MSPALTRSTLHASRQDQPYYCLQSALALDSTLVPSIPSSKLNKSERISSFIRAPFTNISNQAITTIAEEVNSKWLGVKWDRSITQPTTFHTRNEDNLPLPTPFIDIQQIESVLSPLKCTNDFTLSTSLNHFADSQKTKQHQPAKTSLLVRNSKRLRTPFPPNHEGNYRHTSESGSDKISGGTSRKRTRIAVETPPVVVIDQDAILEDFQHAREKSRPLVEWLTSHLCRVIILPSSLKALRIEQATALKVLDILAYFKPEAAVIILALWYISKLFPRGLVNENVFHGPDSTETTTRVFVLGMSLANKWFDDFSVSAKSWQRFTTFSLKAANNLERSALKILDYNLSISNSQWKSWLLSLQASASYFDSTCGNEHTATFLIRELLSTAPAADIKYYPDTSAVVISRQSSELYAQIREGLWAVQDCLRPIIWNPVANAFVALGLQSRTVDTAHAVTVLDLLIGIVGTDPRYQ